eukprot:scaffold404437_cov36-Prasinocladus_malaysianus.AAC.1
MTATTTAARAAKVLKVLGSRSHRMLPTATRLGKWQQHHGLSNNTIDVAPKRHVIIRLNELCTNVRIVLRE